MAVMSGATWKPLPSPSKTRMAAYDIVCIHTMVGSLDGTDGYFRRLTTGVNSHFGTGGDGRIFQWVDTAVRSGANGNGNHHIISIENADMGPEFAPWNTGDGNAVPAFTAAQIEANARIIAWAHATHGIPIELIPDAKPGRRGVGYHRQGVPGYMVAGAEQWSSSTGKVCPANRRIAQIPQIIARARQIAGGLPAGPAPEEEDDMPKHLRAPNGTIFLYYGGTGEVVMTSDPAEAARWREMFGREQDVTQAHFDEYLRLDARLKPDSKTPKEFLQGVARRVENTEAQVVALSAAVAALADNSDLTADELEAVVVKAIKENVVTVDIDVTGAKPAA